MPPLSASSEPAGRKPAGGATYQVLPLANGLSLALAHMPYMTSVSVGFWVAVGGRCEPAELSGVSHFIEHMLFKGTRRRSAREISQAVEGIGGYLNAFTSEEHTCFYAKARADRFDDLLQVLADMLLHSRFAPNDIETERTVIKEEIAMYLDQPHQQVQELLNEMSWPDHPLGRPLTGTEQTVDALTRRQMLRYQRSHYVGAATVVAVAGNFSLGHVTRAVRALAGRFRAGTRADYAPALPRQSEARVRLVTKRTEQTQMALGIRTCSRHDERRFALRLLNVILGENMSSRLFQEIREDSGLAYSIYSSLSFFEDAGDLVIAAGLETRNLPKVLALVVRELRRLATEPPGPAEFRRARDYVLGQMDLTLENTESQMLAAGEQVLAYGKIVAPALMKRRLCRVQPREVCAVAGDFLRPAHLNLALVSPLKRDRGLRSLLAGVAG